MEGVESTKPKTGIFKPFLVASCAIPLQISTGAAFGQSAEMLPQLLDPDSFIQITRDESTWIASITVIGMIITGSPAGLLTDKFGRLRMLQLCQFLMAIGFAIVAGAENYTVLIIGRFLIGLGVGFNYASVIYVGEVSPPKFRGALLMVVPFSSSSGLFLIYAIGAALPWNVASGVMSVIGALGFVLSFLYYDTPQWLVSKGRIEEARTSLGRIEHPSNVEARLMEIQDAAAESQKQDGNLLMVETLIEPTVWKPLLHIATMSVLQNGSGFYILCYYAVNFMEEFRTDVDSDQIAVTLGATRVVATIFASLLLRRAGRKTIGAISGLGSTCFLLIIFAYLQLRPEFPDFAKAYPLVPACSLIMYILTSGFGIFPLPWIMPSEFFPLKIRGLMSGVSFALMSVCVFLSVKLYVVMLDNLTLKGTILLFATSSFLFAVYSMTILVETHKKTLEEVQKEFTRGSRGKDKTPKEVWGKEGIYSTKEER